jgi:hypothetical protein
MQFSVVSSVNFNKVIWINAKRRIAQVMQMLAAG